MKKIYDAYLLLQNIIHINYKAFDSADFLYTVYCMKYAKGTRAPSSCFSPFPIIPANDKVHLAVETLISCFSDVSRALFSSSPDGHTDEAETN